MKKPTLLLIYGLQPQNVSTPFESAFFLPQLLIPTQISHVDLIANQQQRCNEQMTTQSPFSVQFIHIPLPAINSCLPKKERKNPITKIILHTRRKTRTKWKHETRILSTNNTKTQNPLTTKATAAVIAHTCMQWVYNLLHSFVSDRGMSPG